MPSDTKQKTTDLVNQYLDLQSQKNKIEEKLDELKIVIAKFSKDTNQKHLKVGNIVLKVKQYLKTTFPRIEEKGREEVEDIMRRSKEWKQAITFDIVKLGTAFDKKKLSPTLMDKLSPYTNKDKVIRITKSRVKRKKSV